LRVVSNATVAKGYAEEDTMIVQRRTWLYRLAGQQFVQSISFERPVTASKVKEVLRRSVGIPQEIWGRSSSDLLSFHK
jgi:hypothetical protein